MHILQRQAHGLERGLQDIQLVYLGGLDLPYSHGQGLGHQLFVQAFALGARQLLGIVDPSDDTVGRQDDGRGHHRPRQAAAPSLIYAGHSAHPLCPKAALKVQEPLAPLGLGLLPRIAPPPLDHQAPHANAAVRFEQGPARIAAFPRRHLGAYLGYRHSGEFERTGTARTGRRLIY